MVSENIEFGEHRLELLFVVGGLLVYDKDVIIYLTPKHPLSSDGEVFTDYAR
jgi:hypothetical protein